MRNPLASGVVLSYQLYYHQNMAQREKRSISLPPELARAVDDAARAEGTTFSAWLAQTAAHRLKLEAGRRAIAEWELENGPLTPEELASGRARARALLGRDARDARDVEGSAERDSA
jgi:predicted transcriptional regulator